MKKITLALTAALLATTTAAVAQQAIKQPTGADVKGCTYYKIVDNKVVCSPVWKEGYKASQKSNHDG